MHICVKKWVHMSYLLPGCGGVPKLGVVAPQGGVGNDGILR